MKANVDKTICIGCTMCTRVCPEVFQMDGNGKSEAIKEVIPKEVEEKAKEARMGCPVKAISID